MVLPETAATVVPEEVAATAEPAAMVARLVGMLAMGEMAAAVAMVVMAATAAAGQGDRRLESFRPVSSPAILRALVSKPAIQAAAAAPAVSPPRARMDSPPISRSACSAAVV